MELTNTNKEKIWKHSVYDVCSFGINQGHRFIDIFKFDAGYIDWMIREPQQNCFGDIDAFFSEGLPKWVRFDKLPKERLEEINSYIKKISPVTSIGHRMYTINDFYYLREQGLIKDEEFEDSGFKFTNATLEANTRKINATN